MDKPRHPQVIRPWKTRQPQKYKFMPQPPAESRREARKIGKKRPAKCR